MTISLICYMVTNHELRGQVHMKIQRKARFGFSRRSPMGAVNRQTALDDRGYTIIEMLVVVTIIGILVSLAIPAYTEYKNMAKVSRATSEIRSIADQIAFYQTDKIHLPDRLEDLPGGIALKDPWGKKYNYYIIPPSDGTGPYRDTAGDPFNTDYDLYSEGANGNTTKSLLDPAETNTSRDDIILGVNDSIVELGSRY